jgi:hypothetical protein
MKDVNECMKYCHHYLRNKNFGIYNKWIGISDKEVPQFDVEKIRTLSEMMSYVVPVDDTSNKDIVIMCKYNAYHAIILFL